MKMQKKGFQCRERRDSILAPTRSLRTQLWFVPDLAENRTLATHVEKPNTTKADDIGMHRVHIPCTMEYCAEELGRVAAIEKSA